MAQEPSPTQGWQRVEFTEARFAIQLPGDWASVPPVLADSAGVVALFTSALSGTCGVSMGPSDGAVTLDDRWDVITQGYWARLPGGYSAERVPTAAGDAARVTFWQERTDMAATFWNVIYFIPAGETTYAVQCTAEDGVHRPPEDDWLSIAETFELLPETPIGSSSPSPVRESGRIERPTEGFAITFPDAWVVRDLPAALGEQQPEVEDEQGSRGRVRFLLVASDPDSDADCLLTDFSEVAKASPPWTSVETTAASRLAMLTEEPGAGAPATTSIDLPAGRAARLDVTLDGRGISRYYFVDGVAWFSLSCESSEPPGDRWLSIAETFEFLPEEE